VAGDGGKEGERMQTWQGMEVRRERECRRGRDGGKEGERMKT
jgi:hypothetical protein